MREPEFIPVPHRMTVEEYLEFEESSEFKHEFWRGEIVAMAGARRNHNTLAAQISRVFNNRLDETSCQATTSDLRVAINENEDYVYPDVTVWCEDALWLENAFDILLTPLIIVEILSESTQSADRIEKLEAYRDLPSVLDYLIVSPERVAIEHYARTDQPGAWLNRRYTRRAETIRFTTLNLEIGVAEFYRRLEGVPEGVLPLSDYGEVFER